VSVHQLLLPPSSCSALLSEINVQGMLLLLHFNHLTWFLLLFFCLVDDTYAYIDDDDDDETYDDDVKKVHMFFFVLFVKTVVGVVLGCCEQKQFIC